ncbi:MAG: hypothetical protein AB7L92_00265 [Alphaproteobacteria bacterium]
MQHQVEQTILDQVMSELADELAQHTSILILVQGKIQGADHWAYATLSPVDYPAFLAAQARGGYDLCAYAREILASGEGAAPPPEILQEIKHKRPDLAFDAGEIMRAALDESPR